ncbi:hypothetical protein CPB86DRAFT_357083 [Serendipita vermifera]|nr:hypothetical protein CPB86DRAFT_357083 [Serendipita vermifera]
MDSHIWLLHYLFLDRINQDAIDWAGAWNLHSMRLSHGKGGTKSPEDRYFDGMRQYGPRGLEAIGREYPEDSSTANPDAIHTGPPRARPPSWVHTVVESPTRCPLTQRQLRTMNELLDESVEQGARSMDSHLERWIVCLNH